MNIINGVLFIIATGVTAEDDFMLAAALLAFIVLVVTSLLSLAFFAIKAESQSSIKFRHLLRSKKDEFTALQIQQSRIITQTAHESVVSAGFICWIMAILFIGSRIMPMSGSTEKFHIPFLWVTTPVIILFFMDSFISWRTSWLNDKTSLEHKIGNPWKNALKLQIFITLVLMLIYQRPGSSSELWPIMGISFFLVIIVTGLIYFFQRWRASNGEAK